MTRILAGCMLVCATVLALQTPAASEESGQAQPFELVRSLRALQDRAAQGDQSALVEQRKLVGDIAERLINADRTAWTDPRNVRAAVVYALSGGEPRVLKALFRVPTLPGVDEKLLNGALAYSEGRNGEAIELLSNIDTRTLEPSLGGHLALVKSLLIAAKDRAKAIKLLDDARLLSPGTLIEETALRREAILMADAGDLDGFERLAAQYLRRFGKSVYADSFRDQFAAHIAGDAYADNAARLPKLERLLQELEPAQRRQFYLAIAYAAIVKARVALAEFAAHRAADPDNERSPDSLRAHVYEAAAFVVTGEIKQGVAMLQGIVRADLEPRDAELADAAAAVAAEVMRASEAADAGDDVPPPAPAGKNARDQARVDATLAVVTRARHSIAQVDAMLSEVRK